MVEFNQRSIWATYALACSDDNRIHDLAFFYSAARDSFLYRDFDDVTDSSISSMASAKHFDALNSASTAVISNL
jgi:hypothetical protein